MKHTVPIAFPFSSFIKICFTVARTKTQPPLFSITGIRCIAISLAPPTG